eukprot:gene12463-12598_t
MNKPVTFHKQIKSSGYGFLQPKVQLGKAKPAPVKLQPGLSRGVMPLAQQLAAHRQYPMDSRPPVVHHPEIMLPDNQPVHPAAGIVRVAYSGDGCRLLTGATDHTARCMLLPLTKNAGTGPTFCGHKGPLTCVGWSHSGELVITASADRTARIWSCGSPTQLITLGTEHHQSAAPLAGPASSHQAVKMSISGSCTGGSGNTTLGRPASSKPQAGGGKPHQQQQQKQLKFLSAITAAQFFHMDELVLLASGNSLHLYRYHLAAGPYDDDIRRLKSCGSYSLAAAYSSSCQLIANVAAPNSFRSNIVLLACSNRSIEVMDAETMQVACAISDAHSRPVTRLVQPGASPFASLPREVNELFASSAPDGLIKLWDVRCGASGCVRSFSGHKCSRSQVPLGLALSPCMRFLATGSDDQAAHVFDLRTGTLLHRLRPPSSTCTDVVTDVAFHPGRPQLAAACINGRLWFYEE